MAASSPTFAATGRVLWSATDDEASYSSGVSATLGGRKLAIFLTRAGLLGLEPANGNVVFRRPWRARIAASVNAASPIVVGEQLFVSAEYGPGAGLLRLDNGKLVDVWSSIDALTTHYATPVLANGVLYGYHGRQEFGPALRAVDLATGKVSEGPFGDTSSEFPRVAESLTGRPTRYGYACPQRSWEFEFDFEGVYKYDFHTDDVVAHM